jgi:hypothetical protein
MGRCGDDTWRWWAVAVFLFAGREGPFVGDVFVWG